MHVGVIGTGSMGAMLVRAWLRTGTLARESLMVVNRSSDKVARLQADYPGLAAGSAATVAAWADVLWLCVKPGDTFPLLDVLKDSIRPETLLVLVSGAVPIPRVEATVAATVAKVIPSIAQEAGAGVTLVVHGSRVQPPAAAMLLALVSGISRPVLVQEEQLRTAADISSCGPALFAYVAAEMAAAAGRILVDMPEATVAELVRETFLATALLMTRNDMPPSEIIGRVRVPGGVTDAGLAALSQSVPSAWDGVFDATRALEDSKMRHL